MTNSNEPESLKIVADSLERQLEACRADLRQALREARDLRTHLRDRDRYIRQLENQIRPILAAGIHEHEQESLS